MAGPSDGRISPNELSGDTTSFLPSFKDVNEFSQGALRALMLATKASNDLPSNGDDFDYYSSFESFRHLMDVEGSRLIQLIQQCMHYHSAKGNLSSSSQAIEIEDKFDVLIDANDQLLEKVGIYLDEAAGLRKTETPLVVATMTPKPSVSGSWNKKSRSKVSPRGSSYTLLASKCIQRPQAKFKEKVDNSDRAFVPKIQSKPHAMKPLHESLVSDANSSINEEEFDSNFSFPHPYQYELDHFKPSDWQLTKLIPYEPKSLEDTPLHVVEEVVDLIKLLNTLKSETEFAVDLEHHSYRTYLGITCLMQISTRKEDYLIDTLALRHEMHILNEVFTNPRIVKVFHGGDSDIVWLQKDFGLYVVNMFDTGQATRVLQFPHFSLAYLLQFYCKVTADKQFQLADWRIRPLPEQLSKYAREDTHYLLYIFDKLRNELLEKGNANCNLLHSVLQRSTQICMKQFEKPRFSENGFLDNYRKTKKVFNTQQMAALKKIYAWRDKIARTEDESLAYVLPNHMMQQIVEILPRETAGILACCNPIPPLVRQNLNEILAIIQEAKETPLMKRMAEPVRTTKVTPGMLQHPKYHSMLHCPHDMSHQGKDTATGQRELNSVPVASKSSLFGDEPAKVQSKITPVITAFSWSSQPPQPNPSLSGKKAAEIACSFKNEMLWFLPLPPQECVTSHSGKHDMETPIKWKLKPPTEKKKVVKDKIIPEPAILPTTGSVIPFYQDEVEEVGAVVPEVSGDSIPLRQQVPSKKKKTSHKGMPKDSSQKGDDAPKIKKEKPPPETEEPTEFKPFNYEEAMKSVFKAEKKGGKGRKRKSYDPDAEQMATKFKVGSKPKITPSSGKKSMSYKQGDSVPSKPHWPRK